MATDSVAPLIVIVGQTASGKTTTAIKLAQMIGGEIICADSRTIYREMDIGTAKPSLAEQKAVAHHLIDVVAPDQVFSAAQFQLAANQAIRQISRRGGIPIVVGGSGLYINGLIYSYDFSRSPDEEQRQKFNQLSVEELTTLLSAKGVELNNQGIRGNKRHLVALAQRGSLRSSDSSLRPNTAVFGLKLDPVILRQRIVKRIELMFAAGLVDEVTALAERYGWDIESMSGIGYRVMRQYLKGAINLQEAKQAFVRRDLSLAKRQRTWFKRDENISWFEQPTSLIAAASNFINKPPIESGLI